MAVNKTPVATPLSSLGAAGSAAATPEAYKGSLRCFVRPEVVCAFILGSFLFILIFFS